MRKTFGPTGTDDGYWKIKTNQEINEILKGQNIMRFIKKQRFNWLGHVEHMAKDNVQKIKRWKPMSKRPIGKPETRWEDDVLEDIKTMNAHNWKKIAQNRESWKKVVEQARTLYRLQCFMRRRISVTTPLMSFIKSAGFGLVTIRLVSSANKTNLNLLLLSLVIVVFIILLI